MTQIDINRLNALVRRLELRVDVLEHQTLELHQVNVDLVETIGKQAELNERAANILVELTGIDA